MSVSLYIYITHTTTRKPTHRHVSLALDPSRAAMCVQDARTPTRTKEAQINQSPNQSPTRSPTRSPTHAHALTHLLTYLCVDSALDGPALR